MVNLKTIMDQTLNVSPKYLRAIESAPADAEKLCKSCGEPGLRVFSVKVATHVDARFCPVLGEIFRFSATPECPVIYFNNQKETYFLRDEVKTRFGLKEKDQRVHGRDGGKRGGRQSRVFEADLPAPGLGLRVGPP